MHGRNEQPRWSSTTHYKSRRCEQPYGLPMIIKRRYLDKIAGDEFLDMPTFGKRLYMPCKTCGLDEELMAAHPTKGVLTYKFYYPHSSVKSHIKKEHPEVFETMEKKRIEQEEKRWEKRDEMKEKEKEKKKMQKKRLSSEASVDWEMPLAKLPRQDLKEPVRMTRSSERAADLESFFNAHKEKYGKECAEFELSLMQSALGTLHFPPLIRDDVYIPDLIMRATMDSIRKVSMLSLQILSNVGNTLATEKLNSLKKKKKTADDDDDRDECKSEELEEEEVGSVSCSNESDEYLNCAVCAKPCDWHPLGTCGKCGKRDRILEDCHDCTLAEEEEIRKEEEKREKV